MHTQKSCRAAACARPRRRVRSRVGASRSRGGRAGAPQVRTHLTSHSSRMRRKPYMHDPRLYMSKKARTRARCTCTTAAHALAFSADCSGRLAPSCGPLDGKHSTDSHRLAPDLAAARGPTAAAATAAAAAELHGITPAMIAADDHTCENRTETPTAAPPRSQRRPHGQTPAESVERVGARGGLAARVRRRLVALARRCRA